MSWELYKENQSNLFRYDLDTGLITMEGPQAAYMAEIQTQMPNLQATNFQQLNQSLLYGTLSPQYLMGQAQYS